MSGRPQGGASAFLLLLAVAALAGLAAEQFSPGPLPPGTLPLACVSYDARYRYNTLNSKDLAEKSAVPAHWLEQDLRRISRVSGCVRTYYSSMGMEALPGIAERLSMQVILGVNITPDIKNNELEIAKAIEAAARHANIRSILVGNEVVLKSYMSKDRAYTPGWLIPYIARVKAGVHVPVATADLREIWLRYPELVKASDFIAVNNLPYWEEVPFQWAMVGIIAKIRGLQLTYPKKKIFLSETGWPAKGLTFGAAQPDPAGMRWHLTEGLRLLRLAGVDYNYLEAFDQPWKRSLNLDPDPDWGLFTRAGLFKFTEAPSWRSLPALCGLLCGLALLYRFRLSAAANLYFFSAIQIFAACLCWAGLKSFECYQAMPALFLLLFLLPAAGMAGVLAISLLETADILSGVRPDPAPPAPQGSPSPFISVHVACRAEAPDMVIETLRSLLALDYPAYEIIVIDNNHSDEALYAPVRKFCGLHAGKLRFFHEDELPGNKGGALNYALERTDPRAELVAVVDADYKVRPEWLRETAPQFSREDTAAVQAPQAYRGWEGSLFRRAMRDEYEGFFKISMVQRAARNALIQHGTMVVLRLSMLNAVGRWSDWCITEDTELGLRLLLRGWRVEYVEKVYGEGLLPDTFSDYRRQRCRWAYGATSIMCRYAKELSGLRPGLTPAQRYFFVAGWAPWIMEAAAPVFFLCGLLLGILWFIDAIFLPSAWLAAPFICFIVGRCATLFINYRLRVGISTSRTLFSWIAGASLIWTISGAVLRRLLCLNLGFLRTGKGALLPGGPRTQLRYTEAAAAGTAQFFASVLQMKYGNSVEVTTWTAALLLLALPPAAALVMGGLEERDLRSGRP